MSKNTSKESSASAEIVIADKMPVLPVIINGETLTSENHAQVGMELTRLFRRAQSAELAILHFGAAFWAVETGLKTGSRGDAENAEEGTVSTRGHGGKFGDKGTGFKAWLEKFAPEISRPTALRYRELAKAIVEKFGIENPIEFFADNPDALAIEEQKKRAEVIEFVSEKSIRGIQLELGLIDAPAEKPKVPGNVDPETGKRKFYPSNKTPAERADAAIEQQRQNCRDALAAIQGKIELEDFAALDDEEGERIYALLRDAVDEIFTKFIKPRRLAKENAGRRTKRDAGTLV